MAYSQFIDLSTCIFIIISFFDNSWIIIILNILSVSTLEKNVWLRVAPEDPGNYLHNYVPPIDLSHNKTINNNLIIAHIYIVISHTLFRFILIIVVDTCLYPLGT